MKSTCFTVNSTSSPTDMSRSVSITSEYWNLTASRSTQSMKPVLVLSFNTAITPCSRFSPETSKESLMSDIWVALFSWSLRSVAILNCTQSPCLFKKKKIISITMMKKKKLQNSKVLEWQTRVKLLTNCGCGQLHKTIILMLTDYLSTNFNFQWDIGERSIE